MHARFKYPLHYCTERSPQTLREAYLYLIILLVFIVYGFSLSFVYVNGDVFLTYLFSGYFILGVIFAVIFRKKVLGGAVTAFPLTFLSWLIASLLFSGLSGIMTPVQAFSWNFQNVLIAGLIFSSVTFVAVLLTSVVFKLFQFVFKRIKKAPPESDSEIIP